MQADPIEQNAQGQQTHQHRQDIDGEFFFAAARTQTAMTAVEKRTTAQRGPAVSNSRCCAARWGASHLAYITAKEVSQANSTIHANARFFMEVLLSCIDHDSKEMYAQSGSLYKLRKICPYFR